MLLAILALVAGLALLLWSADRFVEGAAATAHHLGMPSLLIGMLVVGFGTSAPEMVVSAIAALQGNPGLALGNAYGSNITNIALILGLVAVLKPVSVHSQIVRREMPVLTLVTLLGVGQLWDFHLSRWDAIVLLVVFGGLVGWSIYEGIRDRGDALGTEVDIEIATHPMSMKAGLIWLVVGLVFLVVSSRLLVWGAVYIAQSLGVSNLIIGLTIVAIGTSLPELASSIMAVRKGEHDIALGNVIGSNMFNTLAVVGIAAGIHPLDVESAVLTRDCAVMGALTLGLFAMAYGFRGQGRINRLEGLLLVLAFIGYISYLVWEVVSTRTA